MAYWKVKANSGNRTPGSSDSRWSTREYYKMASKKVRRMDAKRDIAKEVSNASW